MSGATSALSLIARNRLWRAISIRGAQSPGGGERKVALSLCLSVRGFVRLLKKGGENCFNLRLRVHLIVMVALFGNQMRWYLLSLISTSMTSVFWWGQESGDPLFLKATRQ